MPNIMVLQYLKTAGGASPEVLMKAEEFVKLGYQRLLTFEVAGGGFSWFGETPANVMLSAYGLVEFAEMAKVISIDEGILPRTRAWLFSLRASDGHYEESRSAHSLHVGSDPFALTAFVTWALLQAGSKPDEVAPSLRYLRDNLASQDDPYSRSLALNVLAMCPSARPEAEALGRRLVADRAKGWAPKTSTLVYSSGDVGEIEVTALVALALLDLRIELGAVRDCVRSLLKSKNAFGTWHTTTATVLALKALIADQTNQPTADPFSGKIRVLVNGRQAAEVPVSDKVYDVVQVVDLREFTRTGDHHVALEADLSRPQLFAVQLVASYWLPWTPGDSASGSGPLTVRQTYNRTTLAVDDRLLARVELGYRDSPSGSLILLDLGIPPGFSVETESLDRLVTGGTISRWETAGRQLQLYLPPLPVGKPVTFEYALKARFPIRAASPASSAYEYYNPKNRVEIPPVGLEVR